jgi:hypothetical protein
MLLFSKLLLSPYICSAESNYSDSESSDSSPFGLLNCNLRWAFGVPESQADSAAPRGSSVARLERPSVPLPRLLAPSTKFRQTVRSRRSVVVIPERAVMLVGLNSGFSAAPPLVPISGARSMPPKRRPVSRTRP